MAEIRDLVSNTIRMKELMDDLLIEMARTRDKVREMFPEEADIAFGMAQKDPMKLSNYVKYALLEAKKKGRITPTPLSQEPSAIEGP